MGPLQEERAVLTPESIPAQLDIMRFISVLFISTCICLLSAERVAAEENAVPDDASGHSENQGSADGASAESPITLGKQLDSSINLKTGIDYQQEKDYSVAKRERASEYFTRGKLLYDTGDYSSAAEAFKLAYETLPHQAVLGNIALCFDRAGKWPSAVRYYRKYFMDPVSHTENTEMRQRLEPIR